MPTRRVQAPDPAVERALAELREIVSCRYPAATFRVSRGEDPPGYYLIPTVDVEDPGEVFDVVAERLLELQIDQGLPVYVFPVRPIERVLGEVERQLTAYPATGAALPS